MLSRLDNPGSERGTTLVELMVGLAAGMVVLSTLTVVVITTLHGSARVSARVEATQRARVALAKVTEELHSACISPKIAPIGEKSTGTSLEFIHAIGSEGSQVAPLPTKTTIALSGSELIQTDQAATGGTSPNWTYSNTKTTTLLLTNVAPPTVGGAIFGYYQYLNGTLSTTPLPANPLGEKAGVTLEVQVALKASPGATPVNDAGASASVQDSAVLRLTPPSFNEEAVALPCQ